MSRDTVVTHAILLGTFLVVVIPGLLVMGRDIDMAFLVGIFVGIAATNFSLMAAIKHEGKANDLHRPGA